jgi:hypothetical protein
MKREATRNMNMNNKQIYVFREVEAELEKNIDGSISIEKIIKQNNEPFTKLHASRTN